MKKLYILLVISVLFLITCKKIPELKIYNLEISEESVTTTTCEATITAKYSFPTEIYEIKVLINTSEDMDNAKLVDAALDNNVLTAIIGNLAPTTNYYYCFRYSNGINLVDTDTKTFKTQDASLPAVTTKEVTNITTTSAKSGGNVASDGGVSITVRGVCWSTSQNPTTNDAHTSDGNGLGEFTSNLTGLTPNTTYYVRSYATNYNKTAYGEEYAFMTLDGLAAVSTNDVSDITANSAVSGGYVEDDGDSNIIARGVCWSTSDNPTVNDTHTNDGIGLGAFTSNLTELTENTTYYARAYATNENGTVYGEQKSFTTLHEIILPTIITKQVTNITQTSAVSGGVVGSDGYGTVSARGICWGTSQNPTIMDNHTTEGNGLGEFNSNLTGLTESTTYYVRAYAINEAGIAYGTQKTFTTHEPMPTGAINGLFSVSKTRRVYFSQGNLQYQASTNTWRFAEHQWDYIGENNSNISSNYDGWIDLFGWGTGNNPTNSSTNNDDYTSFSDWGNNMISNGGNQPDLWHTLTTDEWVYMFNGRSTQSSIYFAVAQVNGVNGVILLPDDWSSLYYGLNNTNTIGVSYSSNIISQSEWNTSFEANGAVFLPAAGYRSGNGVSGVGSIGHYWSSSYGGNINAYGVNFNNSTINLAYSFDRYIGHSVRLVHNY